MNPLDISISAVPTHIDWNSLVWNLYVQVQKIISPLPNSLVRVQKQQAGTTCHTSLVMSLVITFTFPAGDLPQEQADFICCSHYYHASFMTFVKMKINGITGCSATICFLFYQWVIHHFPQMQLTSKLLLLSELPYDHMISKNTELLSVTIVNMLET